MKTRFLIIITIFFWSCNKDENTIEPEPEPVTTLIGLTYPTGVGYSGNDTSSVIGYGYDATGLCDTVSVKSKVFDINNSDNLQAINIFYSGSNSKYVGCNYSSFLADIKKYPYRIDEPTYSFISHINKLLNIASGSDTIEDDCAFVYYTYERIERVIRYWCIIDKMGSDLVGEFKTDIKSLSPKAIVSKYGTHVIISVNIGAKFEVIYKCKLKSMLSNEDLDYLYHYRMNDFFGKMPNYYEEQNANAITQNEQFIYNSIGFATKSFGLINATYNNSDSIHIDINAVTSNPKYQFVSPGRDGLVPLYELIEDQIKKEELKNYILSLITN